MHMTWWNKYVIISRNYNFKINSFHGNWGNLLPRRWRDREKMFRQARNLLELKVAGRMWQSMTLDLWVRRRHCRCVAMGVNWFQLLFVWIL